MKQFIHILLPIFIAAVSIPSYCIDNFDIILKSKWKELGCKDNNCADFGGKWILVGSITFKRRSKEPISISQINLSWHGAQLTDLTASLYRKSIGKEFWPLEENLICDGQWNSKTQTLILDFDAEEKLAPTTVFYLVLTVPESTEQLLRNGHFCLENNHLPRPFKQCAQHEKLILAINDAPIPSFARK